MNDEQQRLLRAMLDSRRKYDAAWAAYLEAQAAFTGTFAKAEYPLGPFVVGTTLIEHEDVGEDWPQKRDVFNYRDVIRCPTSD